MPFHLLSLPLSSLTFKVEQTHVRSSHSKFSHLTQQAAFSQVDSPQIKVCCPPLYHEGICEVNVYLSPYILNFSTTRRCVVTGHFHALPASPPPPGGKSPLIPTEWEGGCAPDPVWMLWRRGKIFCPARHCMIPGPSIPHQLRPCSSDTETQQTNWSSKS
jgi:hypothetical protein